MESKMENREEKGSVLVDGPPLDFSFKNIRTLTDLLKLGTAPRKEASEDIPKGDLLPKTSEKDIGDATDSKLNIVRTIEFEETRPEIVKQMASKKVEKVPSKATLKVKTRTTALFLRYNKLTKTEGFLEVVRALLPAEWDHLVWVDLSHNRLSTVDPEWAALPSLKNLYLHVNFIGQFKELEPLRQAQKLRTFTIHGNPLENYPQFRALLAGMLPQVQKIDSALLTKRERERALILGKQGKYPLIVNPQKAPEESQDEEEGE